MEHARQQLGNGDWPERWCVYVRAYNERGDARTEVGEGMRVEKNGSLTYRCVCGDTFNRAPGERIGECHEWIARHRSHVAQPALPQGGE